MSPLSSTNTRRCKMKYWIHKPICLALLMVVSLVSAAALVGIAPFIVLKYNNNNNYMFLALLPSFIGMTTFIFQITVKRRNRYIQKLHHIRLQNAQARSHARARAWISSKSKASSDSKLSNSPTRYVPHVSTAKIGSSDPFKSTQDVLGGSTPHTHAQAHEPVPMAAPVPGIAHSHISYFSQRNINGHGNGNGNGTGSGTGSKFKRLGIKSKSSIKIAKILGTGPGSVVEIRGNATETIKEETQAVLSFVSHELRSPLHAITSMSQFLIETNPLSEEQHENVQTIIQTGQLMARIIDDVLDISKYENGRLELELAPFDLHALLHHVIRINQPLFSKRPVQLILNIKDGVPGSDQLVYGDELRLIQILNNLISNASKFTHTGHVILQVTGSHTGLQPVIPAVGAVTIDSKLVVTVPGLVECKPMSRSKSGDFKNYNKGQLPGQSLLLEPPTPKRLFRTDSRESTTPETKIQLEFKVMDTGIGISPKYLDLLFIPYSQAKNQMMRQTKGTGLGLSIVKSLATAMHGTVEVESKENVGSIFTVSVILNQLNDASAIMDPQHLREGKPGKEYKEKDSFYIPTSSHFGGTHTQSPSPLPLSLPHSVQSSSNNTTTQLNRRYQQHQHYQEQPSHQLASNVSNSFVPDKTLYKSFQHKNSSSSPSVASPSHARSCSPVRARSPISGNGTQRSISDRDKSTVQIGQQSTSPFMNMVVMRPRSPTPLRFIDTNTDMTNLTSGNPPSPILSSEITQPPLNLNSNLNSPVSSTDLFSNSGQVQTTVIETKESTKIIKTTTQQGSVNTKSTISSGNSDSNGNSAISPDINDGSRNDISISIAFSIEKRRNQVVMVVDDQLINRKIASKILLRAGFDVVVAQDGVESIAIMAAESQSGNDQNERKISLILMDLSMPTLTGQETTKILRDRGVTIPIVAFTANSGDKIKSECKDCGMNAVITKASSHTRIIRVISKLLELNLTAAAAISKTPAVQFVDNGNGKEIEKESVIVIPSSPA